MSGQKDKHFEMCTRLGFSASESPKLGRIRHVANFDQRKTPFKVKLTFLNKYFFMYTFIHVD